MVVPFQRDENVDYRRLIGLLTIAPSSGQNPGPSYISHIDYCLATSENVELMRRDSRPTPRPASSRERFPAKAWVLGTKNVHRKTSTRGNLGQSRRSRMGRLLAFRENG
jgi:hypothetical protein